MIKLAYGIIDYMIFFISKLLLGVHLAINPVLHLQQLSSPAALVRPFDLRVLIMAEGGSTTNIVGMSFAN